MPLIWYIGNMNVKTAVQIQINNDMNCNIHKKGDSYSGMLTFA